MTSRTYYRWSLLLPVVLPILAFAVMAACALLDANLPSGVATPIFFLVMSLLTGGIPYAVCAGGLAVAMGSWNVRKIRIVSYLVPIAFAGLMFLLGEVVHEQAAPMYAVFALLFGYSYVLIAHVGYAVLVASGGIDDPPPTTSSARSLSRGTSG